MRQERAPVAAFSRSSFQNTAASARISRARGRERGDEGVFERAARGTQRQPSRASRSRHAPGATMTISSAKRATSCIT